MLIIWINSEANIISSSIVYQEQMDVYYVNATVIRLQRVRVNRSVFLDPNIMKKTGRVLMAPDLASEYGFSDVDGTVPANMRSVRQWLARGKWSIFAPLVPDFIKLPGWMISMSCSHL